MHNTVSALSISNSICLREISIFRVFTLKKKPKFFTLTFSLCLVVHFKVPD